MFDTQTREGIGVLLTLGLRGVRWHAVGGRGDLGLAVDVLEADGDGRGSRWRRGSSAGVDDTRHGSGAF